MDVFKNAIKIYNITKTKYLTPKQTLFKTNKLKFSLKMFTKVSTDPGNKHEMAILVMLLIGRHKTANLYLFKSYPTIIESIFKWFIFYNKQRKRKSRITMFKYFIIVS